MLSIKEIKSATKGQLLQGDDRFKVRGISIDSRTIKKRSIFIAVKGHRFNGHNFIQKAVHKGAVAVLVSKKIRCSKNIAVIYVKDTTIALGQIASLHLDHFPIPIIAITGSAGKTTTKEMVASVLSKRYKVLKNSKSENNHYGVPLTLLKLRPSHDIAVIELGTNQPGDIRRLAQIVRPTVCLLTNIGHSHLERLKSQRGVFNEKIQMIKYMDPKGFIVINGDDHYLNRIKRAEHKQKIIRFGINHGSDHRICNITIQSNRQLSFKLGAQGFKINSSAIHNVYNALAAISCGLLYKIRYNDIKAALSQFKFTGSRQEIVKNGRFWLIDDTYNANPLSLRSAVSTLTNLQNNGKRIIVCADMLELGSHSKNLHQLAGRFIAKNPIDAVFTIGNHSKYITQSLNQFNGNRAVHCDSLSEVHRRLKHFCNPGDAILVKGSRSMKMERTVAFLKTHFK